MKNNRLYTMALKNNN